MNQFKKVLIAFDTFLPTDIFTGIIADMEKEKTVWGKISVLLP